jgi:predicted ribosomally synthesized peptide with SipW-like signal peptide
MVNKSIFLSLLLIGVVAASAGAGTWATFSDAGTSAGNTFTAGTMNLTMSDIDGVVTEEALLSVERVVPGDTDVTVTGSPIIFENDGNTAGDLTLTIPAISIVDYENEMNEAEEEDDVTVGGDLSPVLVLTFTDGTAAHTYTGTLATLAGLPDGMDFGELSNLADTEVIVTYTVDGESVGNEIQSDNVKFTLEATLEQVIPSVV